jgi:hypothetical protein
VEEKPTTPLEVLAERLGPVSTQIVAQINAGKEHDRPQFNLHFEDELIDHLRDLETRAQAAPGGGAHAELSDLLLSFDQIRTGGMEPEEPEEPPYVEVADLPSVLPEIRDHFRNGEDDPYLIGVAGDALAGLISYDLYVMLQQVSVDLNGTEEAPVLPLPRPEWEDGPEIQPFELAVEVCSSVIEDIAAGEGSMLIIGDEAGEPELVLAPLVWLWAYVDHLDTESAGT